jgi:hypothetical protein
MVVGPDFVTQVSARFVTGPVAVQPSQFGVGPGVEVVVVTEFDRFASVEDADNSAVMVNVTDPPDTNVGAEHVTFCPATEHAEDDADPTKLRSEMSGSTTVTLVATDGPALVTVTSQDTF